MANAIPCAFRFVYDIVDQIADVLAHCFDDAERFFEDISDEIRNRDAKILGHSSNVLGEGL